MQKTLVIIGHGSHPNNLRIRHILNRMFQVKVQLHQLEQESPTVFGKNALTEKARTILSHHDAVIVDCSDEKNLGKSTLLLLKEMKDLKKNLGIYFSIPVDTRIDMELIERVRENTTPLFGQIGIITYGHDAQFRNGVLSVADGKKSAVLSEESCVTY